MRRWRIDWLVAMRAAGCGCQCWAELSRCSAESLATAPTTVNCNVSDQGCPVEHRQCQGKGAEMAGQLSGHFNSGERVLGAVEYDRLGIGGETERTFCEANGSGNWETIGLSSH